MKSDQVYFLETRRLSSTWKEKQLYVMLFNSYRFLNGGTVT